MREAPGALPPPVAPPVPYLDLQLPYQVLLIVALGFALFVLFVALRRLHEGFRGAGFTAGEATAILLVAPILGLVNVPLTTRGHLTLAVNLGGAVVPALIAAKLVFEERAPRWRTALATALVAAASYAASAFVPGTGVQVTFLVPVALTALLAVAFTLGNLRRAAPLAYAAGTLGILIGADLFRLEQILAYQPASPEIASIGGRGALDAVFLVGVVAVGLHLLLWGAVGRKRR